jgi:2-keto-4-pentenoate hydratase/2-oxohepta-3-ene-1,7-dioic acid hydratase in catechol pathway
MKLMTFSAGSGGQRVGIADPAREVVRDLSAQLPEGVELLDVVSDWQVYAAEVEGAEGLPELPLTEVKVHAPFPEPRRSVFCVGKNYRDHVVESGRSGYDSPDRSEAIPDAPRRLPQGDDLCQRPPTTTFSPIPTPPASWTTRPSWA